MKTFHFRQSLPIPSYLIAIAVGNLASQDVGPRTRVWTEPERLKEAAFEFAETEAYVSTAEKLLTPYEWTRYDLLVLPGSFPYGGMEVRKLCVCVCVCEKRVDFSFHFFFCRIRQLRS
jgi:leukotriene-A4 hydrolase